MIGFIMNTVLEPQIMSKNVLYEMKITVKHKKVAGTGMRFNIATGMMEGSTKKDTRN